MFVNIFNWISIAANEMKVSSTSVLQNNVDIDALNKCIIAFVPH